MIKKLIYLNFLLIIVLVLFSCSKKENKVDIKIQTIPVSVYKVPEPRDLEINLNYPGKLKSISSVTVYARITGILEKMYFKEGQFVKKGTLLFLIEEEPYRSEYNSAKAELEKNLAEFKKAERDWNRIKSAFEDKVVSEEERDSALYAYEKAKAEVKYAEAKLEQAKINLSYTRVLAPEEGIIGERMVDVGNLVTPGTPLVKITKVNPIYVDFSIPESDLTKLRIKISEIKGLPIEVFLENFPFKFSGYIDFIDTVVDEKTSTVKARGILKNTERRLLPGQFVRLTLKGIKRRNVILVPQKAVIQTPNGPAVWFALNGKAQMRFIKLEEGTEEYFIVKEGLKPGDMVIVDNLMKLRPGVPILIDRIFQE